MSAVTSWFADFKTPSVSAFGIEMALKEFIIQVSVGGVREGGVDRHSTVLASITEVTSAPGNPVDFPFIGDAQMLVLNTAPRDDGIIDFRLQVNWSAPLNIRLNFITVNG
jgi:hypothetical protein